MGDVDNKVKMIVEGLLLAAGRPLSLDNIAQVFSKSERPDRKELKAVMDAIAADCDDRGFELKEVASGFRFQVKQEIGEWVAKLWEERPPRYTRALLETLALIAYRQPITRGDIEEIRGVSVSPNIIRTLLDREWVRVVGHRDVPGRPALFATTKQFLDYFNIKSLQELPPLSEIKELAQTEPEVDLAEELAKQRVIDLPDEEEDENQEKTEQEMAELLAEEEAVELSKKPLDEILSMGPYEKDDEELIDDEEDDSEKSVDGDSASDSADADESSGSEADEADESNQEESVNDMPDFASNTLEEDSIGSELDAELAELDSELAEIDAELMGTPGETASNDDAGNLPSEESNEEESMSDEDEDEDEDEDSDSTVIEFSTAEAEEEDDNDPDRSL